MLVTEFHRGQGLGNQLWLYSVTRSLAYDRGMKFGIQNPFEFKALDFLDIDFGEKVIINESEASSSSLPMGIQEIWEESPKHHPLGYDISDFDPSLFKVQDNTKIIGNLQSERYIAHNLSKIREWITFKNSILNLPNYNVDELCVINFRGGEYRHLRKVFLPLSYWENAKQIFRRANPKIRFIVVTDDFKLAKRFFPRDEVLNQSIAEDFFAIYTARNLILSNSSFAWFPSKLNMNQPKVIAPRYWWGYNKEIWSCEYNRTSQWIYLDKHRDLYKLNSNFEEIPHLKCFVSKSLTQEIAQKLKDLLHPLIYVDQRRMRWRTKIWFELIMNKLTRRTYGKIKKRIVVFIQNITQLNLKEIPLRVPQNSKSTRVTDVFYFNDEIELALLRLEVLNDFVDEFVVIESRQTFSGKEKALIFAENIHKFQKYAQKIKLVEVPSIKASRDYLNELVRDKNTDLLTRRIAADALKEPSLQNTEEHWLIEFFQKQYAIKGFLDGEPEDTIFVSDVDEFWNPKKIVKPRYKDVVVYKQIPLVFFMNLRSTEDWSNWTGSVVATRKRWLDSGINSLRIHRRTFRRVILHGGWHLTFQGGKDKILNKLHSYGHQEFNNSQVRMQLDSAPLGSFDFRSSRGRLVEFKKREWPEFILKLSLERPECFKDFSNS